MNENGNFKEIDEELTLGNLREIKKIITDNSSF